MGANHHGGAASSRDAAPLPAVSSVIRGFHGRKIPFRFVSNRRGKGRREGGARGIAGIGICRLRFGWARRLAAIFDPLWWARGGRGRAIPPPLPQYRAHTRGRLLPPPAAGG